MQRRQLAQYMLWSGAFGWLTVAGEALRPLKAQTESNTDTLPVFDWVFMYWMPYDNDLAYASEGILQQIAQGVQGQTILVVIMVDLVDTPNLSRICVAQGQMTTQVLNQTDSSDAQVFAEYLEWARKNFAAKRWAIAILGHGGRLDEISPDANPTAKVDRTENAVETWSWMSLHQLSAVITQFNRQVRGRVELVFLQNCDRATAETLYTFRHAARYTLASQLLLGVPNTYYESLFRFLAHNPRVTGGQLAQAIVRFDAADMYHSYTVTDNATWYEFAKKLRSLLRHIQSHNLASIQLDSMQTYQYAEETYVDLVNFLQVLTRQTGASQALCDALVAYIQQQVIYSFKSMGQLFHPEARETYRAFSGIGLFWPRNQAELETYRRLSAPRELGLIELFEAIAAARSPNHPNKKG